VQFVYLRDAYLIGEVERLFAGVRSDVRHRVGAGQAPARCRANPPGFGSERDMLRTFLDYHRATLVMKCDGLTDAELRKRSTPPSTLSLLSLVRHM
jgi:hypothetical protein